MSERLVGLDIVRFLAALAVVFYHFFFIQETNITESPAVIGIAKYGYLGVPLFFMISGYVITMSAANRSAYHFAVSRFVRLYPIYFVSLFFTILVTVALVGAEYPPAQVLANMTLLNAYIGYENIDLVYWTLLAELKFYFCIFLLLAFRVFDSVRVWLSLWLLLTLMHLLIGQPFFMGWIISPDYSPFFIAGVVFYLIQKEGLNLYTGSVLGITFLASTVSAYSEAGNFIYDLGTGRQIQAIVVTIVCGFFLLFYALISWNHLIRLRPQYLLIGGLTYPLYLIHSAAGKAIIDFLPLPYAVSAWLTILLLLGVALGLHIVIDRHFAAWLKQYLFDLRSGSRAVLVPTPVQLESAPRTPSAGLPADYVHARP